MRNILGYVFIVAFSIISFLLCFNYVVDMYNLKNKQIGSSSDVTCNEVVDEIEGYYSISYDLNGGILVNSNPTKYNLFTETFVLNNPKKTGFDFIGWTGSNLDNPTKNVLIKKGSSGNLSFVAVFERKLDTPYVEINDDIVHWYLVDGADYYSFEIVTFEGSVLLYETTTTLNEFALSQIYSLLSNDVRYWIKVKAKSNNPEITDSNCGYIDYVYLQQEVVDVNDISAKSSYNKAYFVDEYKNNIHYGTLFIQLEDISGDVWGIELVDFGNDLDHQYYCCDTEDISLYKLAKDNNVWSLHTTDYSLLVDFFENTKFKYDDEHYYKFIQRGHDYDTVYTYTISCLQQMFDGIVGDRQNRASSLGYSTTNALTELHEAKYYEIDFGLFTLTDECIDGYSLFIRCTDFAR